MQVSIKKPGIRVRTRKGYWAASPDDALRADLLRPRPPPPLEPAVRISPLVKPWFGVSRGAAGKTRVMFVWEPAPPVPGVENAIGIAVPRRPHGARPGRHGAVRGLGAAGRTAAPRCRR